jgi:rhamnosyltransferase
MPLVGPKSRARVDATVFIPTFNGEKYLERLLTAVESQDFAGNFEILIIDSGSTDRTLDIIAAHPSVRIVTIPQMEFGHGKTRNQAAQLARGTNIAYLSHDAIPMREHWLSALLEPLNPAGLDCVAVVGRHVSRADCFPLLKYEIDGVFAQCGPADRVTVVDGAFEVVSRLGAGDLFYSDVNSATRREFLLNVIPYRDVSYSEDMAFARDLLAAGYRKAYQPAALVEHSNDVTLAEYPKRIFDETVGLRRVGDAVPIHGFWGTAARLAKDVLRSSARIIRDGDYGVAAKVHWLVLNPRYVWAKWTSMHRAARIRLDDGSMLAKYSLEAERS